MFNKKIASSLIFSVITTFSIQANAQTLDHLPGYKFNPKNIPFLNSYKIENDNTYYQGRSLIGVQRKITLKNKNNNIISIHIHIAQDKTLDTSSIIKNIIKSPFLSTGFAYNKKDHKKVGIGEVLYANVLGPIKGGIRSGVLFSRNNIIIQVLNRTTGTTLDIEPLAKQIDKDIDNTVKVTFKEIEAYKPIIEKLKLDKEDIKEYTQTKLTIQIKDPNKKSTQFFYETKGDVIEENGQYLFDSPIKLGKDTLTIIVVNDHLLYSEKTIEFTVIK